MLSRDLQDGKVTSLLEVIRIFTESLSGEEKIFEKVWDSLLSSSPTDSSNGGGLYFYSGKMAKMIENDIQAKLDDLDFDKDPFKIVGDLIEAV